MIYMNNSIAETPLDHHGNLTLYSKLEQKRPEFPVFWKENQPVYFLPVKNLPSNVMCSIVT